MFLFNYWKTGYSPKEIISSIFMNVSFTESIRTKCRNNTNSKYRNYDNKENNNEASVVFFNFLDIHNCFIDEGNDDTSGYQDQSFVNIK